MQGIAVAVGVGFAVGVVAAKRKRAAVAGSDASRHHYAARKEAPVAEPLRSQPLPAPVADSFTELNTRVRDLSQDMDTLRRQMNEQREGMPALFESTVAPRMEDLRLRLRTEMQQSVHATLTTFERAIEDKVSDRVSVIEKAVPDQSAVVAALSQRALELDLGMQRLIVMMERLCERTGTNIDMRTYGAAKPPASAGYNGSAFGAKSHEAA